MRREGNDLTFRSLMGPGTKNHNAVWQKEARGLVGHLTLEEEEDQEEIYTNW